MATRRERPIIMSGPMVEASLARRKVKTRRLAGLEVVNLAPDEYELVECDEVDTLGRLTALFKHKETEHEMICTCPYGYDGDLLYVRENWAVGKGYDDVKPRQLPHPDKLRILQWFAADGPYPETAGKPRPAIHHPKSYARLWLTVEGIGVGRVNGIDQKDAMLEGMQGPDFVADFFRTWDRLHGKESRLINPWTWEILYTNLRP